jgi:UDP-N-acetylmuramoyl-L-alanyl-D-glutamate--2,6-diaminopimelate ligase
MIQLHKPLTAYAGFNTVPSLEGIGVSALTFDSREAGPGVVFVALPSVSAGELGYIQAALAAGTQHVLHDASLKMASDIRCTAIDMMAVAGAFLADYYAVPAGQMSVLGVTGTNGKSSTTFYISQLLSALGKPCAVMGTLGYGWPHALREPGMTTLPLPRLHKAIADLYAEGFRAIAMEVSSHGLDQQRLAGVHVRQGVLTNLTRDHLDYHGDMQSYQAAKQRLFERPEVQDVVVNLDDAFGRSIAAHTPKTCLSYGTSPDASVRYELLAHLPVGMSAAFSAKGMRCEVQTNLFGEFNLQNIAAAVAVCLAEGYTFTDIMAHVPALQAVPGRMQAVSAPQKPVVIVDYAHTPDALEKVLLSLREHHPRQLHVVVGCGGDRDKGKRPLMGQIAVEYADTCIFTSDNPRSENPQAILADMLQSIESRSVQVEVDRATAITQAIAQAQAGDIVLIAGKGHEDYQEIQGVKLPFSDLETAILLLGVKP